MYLKIYLSVLFRGLNVSFYSHLSERIITRNARKLQGGITELSEITHNY